MRRKTRTHSAEYKAKAALAAIPGDVAMDALVKTFEVHAHQITDWKRQLLNSAPDVFRAPGHPPSAQLRLHELVA